MTTRLATQHASLAAAIGLVAVACSAGVSSSGPLSSDGGVNTGPGLRLPGSDAGSDATSLPNTGDASAGPTDAAHAADAEPKIPVAYCPIQNGVYKTHFVPSGSNPASCPNLVDGMTTISDMGMSFATGSPGCTSSATMMGATCTETSSCTNAGGTSTSVLKIAGAFVSGSVTLVIAMDGGSTNCSYDFTYTKS